MDDDRARRALGGLILALILAPAGWSAPAAAPPVLVAPDPPAAAAALGWPIAAGETNPAVWQTLPGIGPSRAEVLAAAAAQGSLQQPDDLLRLPGFGIKMAGAVAPRVLWAAEEPSSTTFGFRTEHQQ
jgi:hypothetical protein